MTPPPPLTPADCNLRDFGFMPWEITRFRQSALVAQAEPEAILAAILLWGEAWQNVPAASLEDNDKLLARAAGYGRAVDAWLLVKEEAMRGFVKCSDGRLYHETVAEKARVAWEGKLKQRWKTYCAAIRMHNSRNEYDQRERPTFEAWLETDRPTEVKAAIKAEVQLALPDRYAQQDDVLRATEPLVTPENHSKGQGEGQGEGEGERDSGIKQHTDSARENVDDVDLPISKSDLIDLTARLCRVGSVEFSPLKLGPYTKQIDMVRAWLKDGIDVETTILPAIADSIARTNQERIFALGFFDTAIRKRHAAKAKAFKAEEVAKRPAVKPWDKHDADDKRVAAIRAKLNGNIWHAPDKVALSIEADDDGTRLIVGTRGSLYAERLDRNLFWDLARQIIGADAEVEVRQL